MNTSELSLSVLKRDGKTVQDFDSSKIRRAVQKACEDTGEQIPGNEIASIVANAAFTVKFLSGATDRPIDVEQVQNVVEMELMKRGHLAVAKHYILYRAKRAEARNSRLTPDSSAIADYIHPAKYARYVPSLKRRELFHETVARVEDMHMRKFSHLGEEILADIKWAFDQVRARRVLPSMRSMQFAGSAIEQTNARIFNCSYTLVDRPHVFKEVLYLLLCGVGVGYSVQYDHVEQLPALKYVNLKDVRHHTVGDTVEGWADALDRLVDSYVKGYFVEFSYHKIRPEGAALKTSGGKAPGHRHLKKSLEAIREILNGAQGRKLRPIECHDILCLAADAVLSGGIRRSAMICLFSIDDGEMMVAKTGDWYVRYPWRANANNSVVLKRDEVKKKQFKRIFTATREFGEPGFFFTDNLNYGTNPCLHPDTRLWTDQGYVRIGDAFTSGVANRVVTDNRVGKGDSVSLRETGLSVRPATNVYLTQRSAKVYELVTEHGYRVKATANHLFPTPEGRKELRDLRPGSVLFLPSGEGQFGVRGSFEEGLVVGMFTGDGTTAERTQSGRQSESFLDVWESDFDKLDEIQKAVNAVLCDVPSKIRRDYGAPTWYAQTVTIGGVKKKRIGGVRLNRWLCTSTEVTSAKAIKKSVPESVWRGSRDMVRGYLQGLIFSDGTVYVSGHDTAKTLSVRITQSNRKLLEDVQILLSMFGVVSRINHRRNAGLRKMPDGRGGTAEYPCRDTYELIINRPNAIVLRDRIGLFGRKADLLSQYLAERGEDCRKPENFVTKVASIEECGESDVYCLTQPETNTIVTNGIVNGQCAEIGLFPVLEITQEVLDIIADRESRGKRHPKVKLGERYTGFAFCNLTEQNAAMFQTESDFETAAKAATIIGTLQASYTDMPYLGWVSEVIAERDSLLGVGMTGIMDCPDIALNPEIQARVAKLVVAWNKEFSAKIGIRPAARTTTVKPSGSTSLALGCVGSGIHPHHARRYIRRVTANENENVFQYFRSVNPHMCVRKPNGDWVVEFPVAAPDGAVLNEDVAAIEFLKKVHSTQKNWVLSGTARPDLAPGLHHNVSNTVTVKSYEWHDVSEYIWENKEYLTGVSLLSETGDKDFAFAPREAITTEADEAKYNRLIKSYVPVDYSSMVEEQDSTNLSGEAACVGGACNV